LKKDLLFSMNWTKYSSYGLP